MDKKELLFLLVDDNPMMLKMMVPMLEELGYRNFILANDGLDAWKKIKRGEEQIHVVISDLIMPKVTGVELLDRVRRSDKFWDLPFIMVTGDDQQNSLMSSVEVDVNSYIIKPFTPEKLQTEINIVINEKYNPSKYMQLLQQGREFLVAANDTEGALTCFEEAKLLKPLDSDPYYFSGIVYERQGSYDKAKEELRRCVELRQGYVKAYDLLALIYRREKNYSKEKEVLETVTELSPNNPDRNIDLGLACANTGDDSLAKKYLKRAGRLGRKHSAAFFEKIFRAYLQGDNLSSDAEGVYRKYIDNNMEDPRLLNKFALILKKYQSYDTAIFFLEQIVNIWQNARNHGIPDEDMAVYYFNLAVAYTEQSRQFSDYEKLAGFKTAAKNVNKAIDCDPEHQDSRKLYAWLDDRIR